MLNTRSPDLCSLISKDLNASLSHSVYIYNTYISFFTYTNEQTIAYREKERQRERDSKGGRFVQRKSYTGMLTHELIMILSPRAMNLVRKTHWDSKDDMPAGWE